MVDAQIVQLHDSDLVREIKKSDPDAFKKLYYKYFDKIYNYVWYRTSSKDLSQDLVQETFTRVWQSRDKLDPEQSVSSYIYRIAGNLVVDHIRKASVARTTSQEEIGELPDANAEKNFELSESILKALDELPEDQSLVFILNRFEGFKQREIAEMLDISIRTVESRISKVLINLRQNLRSYL